MKSVDDLKPVTTYKPGLPLPLRRLQYNEFLPHIQAHPPLVFFWFPGGFWGIDFLLRVVKYGRYLCNMCVCVVT